MLEGVHLGALSSQQGFVGRNKLQIRGGSGVVMAL